MTLKEVKKSRNKPFIKTPSQKRNTNKQSLYVFIFFIVCFTFFPQKAHSFDYEDTILSVTNFLDSLSFNYKGFDVKLKEILIEETYDDNVTFEEDDKLDDYITNIGFAAGVEYEGKNRSMGLFGKIVNQTFAEHTEFDNLTEEVQFSFQNEFSKYDRISIHNLFVHTEAPLFFRDDFFEEQLERDEQRGRFDRFNNTFDIDYTREITKNLNAGILYTNGFNLFSGIDLLDSYLNELGISADYSFNYYTTLLFTYVFSHRDFESPGDDALINSIAPGIRYYITKNLFLEGTSGISIIDSFSDRSIIKHIFNTSINRDIDVNTQASVLFEKKYETSQYSENVREQWRASASLRRRVSERLLCSFQIFYGENKSIDTDFKQELIGSRVFFTYDITRNFKGRFAYSYSDADSNAEDADYTKNTFSLGITAEF